MARKVTYWVTTILLAVMTLPAAFAYLSGSPQAVQGFAHVGYPQQLRIILGIAKPLGAIALIVPGMAYSKSGPMPDSHSRGSVHFSRTISRKKAWSPSDRSCFWLSLPSPQKLSLGSYNHRKAVAGAPI